MKLAFRSLNGSGLFCSDGGAAFDLRRLRGDCFDGAALPEVEVSVRPDFGPVTRVDVFFSARLFGPFASPRRPRFADVAGALLCCLDDFAILKYSSGFALRALLWTLPPDARLLYLSQTTLSAYGHFATGGIDERIDSTLPPVFSPKIVPRS